MAVKKKAVRKSATKKAVKQTGKTNIAIDKKIQAKSPGKRKTTHKTTYYENRANRSDKGKLLGIGAVKKELSGKYKLVVNNIAHLTGEIAKHKIFLANADTKSKPAIRTKIKTYQAQLKIARALKTKLSKFK